MKILPPRFSKQKLGIPAEMRPDAIFTGFRDEVDAALTLWNSDGFQRYDLVFPCVWVEDAEIGNALLIKLISDEEFESWYYYRNSEKPLKASFTIYDSEKIADFDRGAVYEVSIAALVAISRIAGSSVVDVGKITASQKNRELLVRGDGYTYARLKDFAQSKKINGSENLKTALKKNGVRVRDHPVRGHWRNLGQGRRIWVRSHRRGDASLGSVSRMISQ